MILPLFRAPIEHLLSLQLLNRLKLTLSAALGTDKAAQVVVDRCLSNFPKQKGHFPITLLDPKPPHPPTPSLRSRIRHSCLPSRSSSTTVLLIRCLRPQRPQCTSKNIVCSFGTMKPLKAESRPCYRKTTGVSKTTRQPNRHSKS
jgi:hypothetical protein